MGVTISPALDAMFEFVGVHSQKTDEDAITGTAQDLRVVSAHSTLMAQDADHTMRQATEGYQGRSATELANFWQQTGGDTGHLQQATTLADAAPPILDGAGSVVSAGKLAAATQVASFAKDLPALLAAGGVGYLVVRQMATRAAVRKIDHEVEQGVSGRLASLLNKHVGNPLRQLRDRIMGPRDGFGDLAPAGGPSRIAGNPYKAADKGGHRMNSERSDNPPAEKPPPAGCGTCLGSGIQRDPRTGKPITCQSCFGKGTR